MSSAERRREAIVALVASRPLATQDDLVAALAELGLEASQASVSRDIAALGLVKVGGLWALPPREAPSADPREERIAAYLLSVAAAGDHLLVLKTPPGEAPGVALALDRLAFDGVVGTVAGDDTILVALTDRATGRRVADHLNGLLLVG